jgi:hypothetical protein
MAYDKMSFGRSSFSKETSSSSTSRNVEIVGQVEQLELRA